MPQHADGIMSCTAGNGLSNQATGDNKLMVGNVLETLWRLLFARLYANGIKFACSTKVVRLPFKKRKDR